MINDIKKSERLFSRKELEPIYFSKCGQSVEDFHEKKCSYEVYIPLIINKRFNTPIFSSIAIKNIKPQDIPKTIIITDQKTDGCHEDKARFGEFVFLLAAKLKYDLLCEVDYDKAGFLYSKELTRFFDECKTTGVPPSVLWSLRRIHANPRNPILKNLFIENDQLWHLICYYGKMNTNPRQAKLMYWLNVAAKDIHFVNRDKKEISGGRLKSLLGNMFPEKYCIMPEEFNEFIAILNSEKTERIRTRRRVKLIIRPSDINDDNKTVVDDQKAQDTEFIIKLLAKIKSKLTDEASNHIKKKLGSSNYQPLDLEIGVIEHERYKIGVLSDGNEGARLKKHGRVWHSYNVENLDNLKGVCILSSDVGTGKTTFLRHLQKKLLTENNRIPVYIHASEIEEWKCHDYDSLEECLKTKLKLSAYENEYPDVLKQVIREKLLLLVDGMDQISGTGTEYGNFLDEFLDMVHLKLDVIIASRPVAVISAEDNEDICFLQLRPFCIDAQKAYFGRYYEQAFVICEKRIEMLSVPMLAYMVRKLVNEGKATSISNRASLYKSFVSYVLDPDKYKHDKIKLSFGEIDTVREILQRISFDALNNKKCYAQQVPFTFCRKIVDDYPKFEIDKLFKLGLVNLLAEPADAKGKYLFYTHRSFQEYLAAEWVSENNDRVNDLIDNCWDPKWKETIKFMCGMENGRHIVERIYPGPDCDNMIHSRLFLAAECAGEMVSGTSLKARLFKQVKPLCSQIPFGEDAVSAMVQLHTADSLVSAWDACLKQEDSCHGKIENKETISGLYTTEHLKWAIDNLSNKKYESLANKYLAACGQHLDDVQISDLIYIYTKHNNRLDGDVINMLSERLNEKHIDTLIEIIASQNYPDFRRALSVLASALNISLKQRGKIIQILKDSPYRQKPFGEDWLYYFLCKNIDSLLPQETDILLDGIFNDVMFLVVNEPALYQIGQRMNPGQIELCRKMLQQPKGSFKKIKALFLLCGVLGKLDESEIANICNLIFERIVFFIDSDASTAHRLESVSIFTRFLDVDQKADILDRLNKGKRCQQINVMKIAKYFYKDLQNDHIEYVHKLIRSYNKNYNKKNYHRRNVEIVLDAIDLSSYVVHRISEEHLQDIISCPCNYSMFVDTAHRLARKMTEKECDMILKYMNKGTVLRRSPLDGPSMPFYHIPLLNPNTVTKECVTLLKRAATFYFHGYPCQAYEMLKKIHDVGRTYLL